MKHIIDLNSEIEKIVNPHIQYHYKHDNITYFGKWINEIPESFFEEWEQEIKEKIDLFADLGNPIKLNIIKIVHQDILEKYSELSKIDFKNTELLQTYFSYYNYKNLFSPKNKCSFFTYSFDSDFIKTLERFAFINGIKDFDPFDGNHDPETHKDLLEDEVRFKLDFDDKSELRKAFGIT